MNKTFRIILIGYSLSFIILIVAFIISQKLRLLMDYSNKIEQTFEVRNQILKVQANLIQAENSQRGFILQKDSSLLKPFSHAQRNILDELATLAELTKDSDEQRELIVELKNTIRLRFQLLYHTIDDALDGKMEGFLKNDNEGSRIMEHFKQIALRMEEIEIEQLERRRNDKGKFEKAAPLFLNIVLVISCLFQIFSFVIIIKEFKRSMAYHKELEKKIHELNVTNTELEQIAFVASHDLQEPLRKIRTFSDLLVNKHKQELSKDGNVVLERLSLAATRMQGLMEDLVDFTRILKTEENLQPVDLNDTVNTVLAKLQQPIESKKAIINITPLPTIDGYPKQLQLLFVNLLENALKFVEPNVSPAINISVDLEIGDNIDPTNEIIKEHSFHKISVSDNGIGFQEEFSKKIFVIFQRLHTQNSAYTGKGIGLAICKRVMINHNGFITASGEPGKGATFNLYFPYKLLS